MARMIPSQCNLSTESAAERKLFDLLMHDPGTTEWTVLHSLGLSRGGRRPYGEIDFVVLIPAGGIFCLEIKGGRIACHNGEWETTNRFGQTDRLNRSPFLQAREGMFSLCDAINDRAPPGFLTGLVYGYAVVMPDVSFPAESPEWASWEVIDRDSLNKSVSLALRGLVNAKRKAHQNATALEPTQATIRILVQLLRPDFELIVTRSTRIEETEIQLLQLTEEQFATIDTLADNERCLIEGAAGTGKTMLALEYARRSAIAGNRTLLICYNRLLGDWFERQAMDVGGTLHLTAGRYFKLLREVIMRSSLAAEFQEQEAKGQRPELFDSIYTDCGKLAVEERNDPFDIVVMDEAQDLLRPGVLEVLNSWIKDGLSAGHWAFFGDFQRQAIFSSMTGDEIKALIKSSAPEFAKGRLTLNCRNTRNIGEETSLLSGFSSPPYRMGQVAGLPVDYHYYKSAEEQRSALTEVLKRLLVEGVKAPDIVVLSPLRLSNSGVMGVEGADFFRLVEIGEAIPVRSRIPVIRFATAQSFKGMESTVIVLCDIEQIADNEPQSLLYIAMSRARSQLSILAHEKTKPFIVECVRRKIQEGFGKIT